uniref:Uncharacterized protein n=1 Tax=Tetranychus urticae TaxID=32264 RepID=T1KL70_TETUR
MFGLEKFSSLLELNRLGNNISLSSPWQPRREFLFSLIVGTTISFA